MLSFRLSIVISQTITPAETNTCSQLESIDNNWEQSTRQAWSLLIAIESLKILVRMWETVKNIFLKKQNVCIFGISNHFHSPNKTFKRINEIVLTKSPWIPAGQKITNVVSISWQPWKLFLKKEKKYIYKNWISKQIHSANNLVCFCDNHPSSHPGLKSGSHF